MKSYRVRLQFDCSNAFNRFAVAGPIGNTFRSFAFTFARLVSFILFSPASSFAAVYHSSLSLFLGLRLRLLLPRLLFFFFLFSLCHLAPSVTFGRLFCCCLLVLHAALLERQQASDDRKRKSERKPPSTFCWGRRHSRSATPDPCKPVASDHSCIQPSSFAIIVSLVNRLFLCYPKRCFSLFVCVFCLFTIK